MTTRWFSRFVLVAGGAVALLGSSAAQLSAQRAASIPDRAIRHDIPMTNMIRRALAAGTRDSTGRPGPNYWQMWMDYDIDASIDPATSVMTGRERVVINNRSPDPLTMIVLRLDQNIFAPNVPRAESMPDITDGMKVTRMAFNGENVNLAPQGRGFGGRGRGGAAPQPELAAFNLGQTVARVALPTPIAPGASGTLEVDWNFEVPGADGQRGLRMGAWGDTLYQVAQWYPRVAMYDDLRGWDTEPYLGPSEFYNNFGSFDVRITMPAGWLVGATGVLQNPAEVLTPAVRERLTHVLESDEVRPIVTADQRGAGSATAAGSRLTWHFVADTVGDFAWATSSRYVWDATRATIPGKGPIPVDLLYLPGHEQQYTQAGPLAQHALEFYSKLWMPYAFPRLTLADGPDTGMEYPMFIMSAAGAADHETGHEWWPMMVGTNETWYGFMDEGFNQYMNILSRQDRMGQPMDVNGQGQRYGSISGSEQEGPLMWNANYGGPMYSFQAYQKAPMMLSMLGGVVGDSAMLRAMSDYSKAWRFKHPSPWDYAFFMSNALGRDLGWFWYYWLFTTDAVDGSIQNVTNAGTAATVTVRQDGQMPSPVVLGVRLAANGPPIRAPQNATMVDDTSYVVRWPVDVWWSGSKTFDARLDFGRSITSITFDPWCRFPDADPRDNIWPRSAAPTPQQPAGGRGGGFGRGGANNGICW
ncbi:MAG: M1 family metallopeptidase [Gemmatimonadota bacterium]|jgi:hypothetical protein